MMIKRVVLGSLIIALLFCGSCSSENEQSNPVSDAVSNIQKTDVSTYTISNPICPLQYSEHWKPYVCSEVLEYSGGCKVTFVAELERKRIPLFSFIMCDESEEGFLLGTLTTPHGVKQVYLVDLYDQHNLVGLSEQTQKQYYAMCHDANVIISKLVYDNGMVLSN